MAHVLAHEIMEMGRRYGIERLGFLTLTFADHVTAIEEAQRRFHSLVTGVVKGRYLCACAIWERQKSGRIHFHLVVALNADIRTGADFEAFERKDYRSANPALRAEWAFWRKTAPKYRFGRTELLPVKSTREALGRYVGKYVGICVRMREAADKGARIVRFIGFKPGDRKGCPQFHWNTVNGRLWRVKVRDFCKRYGLSSTDGLSAIVGPRWAYRFQWEILHTPLTFEEQKALYWEFKGSPMEGKMWQALVIAQRDADRVECLVERVKLGRQFHREYQLKPDLVFVERPGRRVRDPLPELRPGVSSCRVSGVWPPREVLPVDYSGRQPGAPPPLEAILDEVQPFGVL
jgi:hypothetical protein